MITVERRQRRRRHLHVLRLRRPLRLPLLWVLVPVTVALVVVQEMCARMGTVTGKGLADLIREEFGLRITFLLMMAVLVTNLGNAAADFAGVASALEVVRGQPLRLRAAGRGVAIWWLIVFGNYKTAEKIFLVACLVYFAYPISAFLAKPDWAAALQGTVDPVDARSTCGGSRWSSASSARRSPRGCSSTCSPRSSRRRRGSPTTGDVRLDVVLGSIVAVVVAFFIVVACAATLHRAGIFEIASGADAARGSGPARRALRRSTCSRSASPSRRSSRRRILPLVDRVLGLRGARPRGRGQPHVQGGARVLLALHRAHRRSARA